MSFTGELIAGHLGDGVICLTEAEAVRARRARVVRRHRVWVVPNGLSDVPPSQRSRQGGGTPALVMVARFAPPKRQLELIDVMARLDHLDWTLTFVGDGPQLDACRDHGQRLLRDRVTFLGDRDDVPQVLARHQAMVLWSTYEGMPISLLEGMRAELCCIASDLPGVRELFGVPSAGLVARSTAELAAAIEGIVSEPARRSDLARRARARYEASFSASAMERSVGAVYAEVLDLRRRVRRARP
jgi:glycosyltransferase involved in cell wall biosynthesis